MIIKYDCVVCGTHCRKSRSPSGLKVIPKYCSQKCHGIDLHKHAPGKTLNFKGVCLYCGNEFETYKSPSRETPKYCSLKCIGLTQTGKNNPAYNNGRYLDSNGYVVVFMPNHPNSGVKKTVLEHRIIMECKIGRYLTEKEVVHHKDEIKSNNDPDNLMLFKNQSEHIKYHNKIKKQNG